MCVTLARAGAGLVQGFRFLVARELASGGLVGGLPKLEDGDQLVGFLLGLHSSGTPPTAYIHLVGTHPDHRRRGVGHDLYGTFCERARAAGVPRAKAIAAVGHEGPIRFHQALGFHGTEDPNYAGRGRARMVFIKDL